LQVKLAAVVRCAHFPRLGFFTTRTYATHTCPLMPDMRPGLKAELAAVVRRAPFPRPALTA
jgi:hypothetical protein